MLKTQHYLSKLEAFIRKFYTNELIRGTIFFIGLGFVVFSIYAFVEYFLWLKPGKNFFICSFSRSLFVIRFILFPILNYSNFKRNRLQSKLQQ
jgi:hypothetical protein